jgi:hypothetical protein
LGSSCKKGSVWLQLRRGLCYAFIDLLAVNLPAKGKIGLVTAKKKVWADLRLVLLQLRRGLASG